MTMWWICLISVSWHIVGQGKRIMIFKKEKCNRTFISAILYIGLVLLLFSPTIVHGARLYFDPQEAVIGAKGEFFVAIFIDSAEESINTISISINVPEQFTPTDTRDGNSIISLWVERPKWNESTRQLSFSGLIPGGFSGKGAHLLTIEFALTDGEEIGTLSFDPEKTTVLRNVFNAEPAVLILEDTTLSISRGKENLPVEIIDTDPPEQFTPSIIKHDQAFSGKYVIVFSTQDKGSGMCCYQVAEKSGGEVREYTKLKWRDAESPLLLKDQSLKSFVYIKALDKHGNERVAVIAPQSTILRYINPNVIGILILVVAVMYSTAVYVRRRRHEQNIF